MREELAQAGGRQPLCQRCTRHSDPGCATWGLACVSGLSRVLTTSQERGGTSGDSNCLHSTAPSFPKLGPSLSLDPLSSAPSWNCYSVFTGHLLCARPRTGHPESFMSKVDKQMPREHRAKTDGGRRGSGRGAFRRTAVTLPRLVEGNRKGFKREGYLSWFL